MFRIECNECDDGDDQGYRIQSDLDASNDLATCQVVGAAKIFPYLCHLKSKIRRDPKARVLEICFNDLWLT